MDTHLIYFNHIYVVQSLPDHEEQTGTDLNNDIIARWSAYRFEHMKGILIDIESKAQLVDWLASLPFAFHRSKIVPYLHFEIHGSPKGLTLKNGELIYWEELTPLFKDINLAIENNLFISLATCYGAFIFKSVDLLDRIPFFGFIGPVEEITTEEVRADWTSYFDILLTKESFTDAIQALNQSNGRGVYAFLTSENVFDLLRKIYRSDNNSRQKRREKRNRLIRESWKNPLTRANNSRSEIDAYFTNYTVNHDVLMEQIRAYFMYESNISVRRWIAALRYLKP